MDGYERTCKAHSLVAFNRHDLDRDISDHHWRRFMGDGPGVTAAGPTRLREGRGFILQAERYTPSRTQQNASASL